MKLAFSILCGLLLALTPAASLRAAPACVAKAAVNAPAPCHCGGQMPCCAARPAVPAPPAPLAAPNAGAQNLLSLPAPSPNGWPSPAAEISFAPSVSSPMQNFGSAPLYRRNCALLI